MEARRLDPHPLDAGARLEWDGLHNARDLGGHPTPTGRTRHRAVVRSEAPSRLTAAGRRQMIDHGVTCFLDLRSDQEAEDDPSPFADAPGYRRVTILDAEGMERSQAISAAEDLMKLLLEERSHLIARALADLLELSISGGVLLHCRAGKDRTGVIAALLLANAGVDAITIAGDHARSADNMEPLYAIWQQQAATEAERLAIAMRKFAPTRESMLHTLAWLDERYDGVPGYLRASGLGAADVAGLRALLAP